MEQFSCSENIPPTVRLEDDDRRLDEEAQHQGVGMIRYEDRVYSSNRSSATLQFNADIESLGDEGAFSPGKREIPVEQSPVSLAITA